jgi:hypothetical protein
MQQFMETIDYRVTDSSEYLWQCFGDNAQTLGSNGSGYTINITFDCQNQTVYEMEAHDYVNDRAYRLINPAYLEAHRKEAKQLNVNMSQAWDDVNFVDLDVKEDWLEKAQAIVAGKDYDDRVQMPLNLDNELLFDLMKQAHEQDITLNQMIEQALRAAIEQHEKNG